MVVESEFLVKPDADPPHVPGRSASNWRCHEYRYPYLLVAGVNDGGLAVLSFEYRKMLDFCVLRVKEGCLAPSPGFYSRD